MTHFSHIADRFAPDHRVRGAVVGRAMRVMQRSAAMGAAFGGFAAT